jgi:hypothetical protein
VSVSYQCGSGYDSKLSVWDMNTNTNIDIMDKNSKLEPRVSCRLSTSVMVGFDDGSIVEYDIAKAKPIKKFDAGRVSIDAVAVDTATLYVGRRSEIEVWNRQNNLLSTKLSNFDRVSSLCVADGSLFSGSKKNCSILLIFFFLQFLLLLLIHRILINII